MCCIFFFCRHISYTRVMMSSQCLERNKSVYPKWMIVVLSMAQDWEFLSAIPRNDQNLDHFTLWSKMIFWLVEPDPHLNVCGRLQTKEFAISNALSRRLTLILSTRDLEVKIEEETTIRFLFGTTRESYDWQVKQS